MLLFGRISTEQFLVGLWWPRLEGELRIRQVVQKVIWYAMYHLPRAFSSWCCSSMFIPQTLHESAFDHHIFSHHGQSQKNFYHPCIRGMWSDSRTKETKKKSDDAGKKDGKEEDELSLKLDPLAALEDPISTSTFRQQQHPMVESNRLSVKNTMSLERQRAKNEGVLFLWLSSEFILTWRSSWGRPADGENCHGAATSRTWAVKGAPTELSPEMISKCMCSL